MKKEENKWVSIKIKVGTKIRLKMLAAEYDIGMSAVIDSLIRNYKECKNEKGS